MKTWRWICSKVDVTPSHGVVPPARARTSCVSGRRRCTPPGPLTRRARSTSGRGGSGRRRERPDRQRRRSSATSPLQTFVSRRVERQHEEVELVLEGLEVEVVLRVGVGLLVLDEVVLERLRRAARERRVGDVQADLGPGSWQMPSVGSSSQAGSLSMQRISRGCAGGRLAGVPPNSARQSVVGRAAARRERRRRRGAERARAGRATADAHHQVRNPSVREGAPGRSGTCAPGVASHLSMMVA